MCTAPYTPAYLCSDVHQEARDVSQQLCSPAVVVDKPDGVSVDESAVTWHGGHRIHHHHGIHTSLGSTVNLMLHVAGSLVHAGLRAKRTRSASSIMRCGWQ